MSKYGKKTLQCCKLISLQLIKINGREKKKRKEKKKERERDIHHDGHSASPSPQKESVEEQILSQSTLDP